MKNINWGADFNLLYARYYSKYLVDGKEYNQTLNEFKYSNIINPNNSISIGNTCSSSVLVSVRTDTTQHQSRKQKLRLRKTRYLMP